MPLAVGEIVQHTFKGLYNNQRIMLVTNWKVVSTSSAGTLMSDLNAMNTYMKTAGAGTMLDTYRACLANDMVVTVSRSQVVRPARSLYMEDYFTAAGLWASGAVTGNTACTVTRVSQAAGRKGVSTSHIGPIAANASVQGELAAALITAMTDFGDRWIQDITIAAATILLRPVILHPVGAVIPSSTIETYRLGTTTRTMRRRTVGLGE